mgnify:CR=1 FL=1
MKQIPGKSWNYAGKTLGGVWADAGLDTLADNYGWTVGLGGAIIHWDGTSYSGYQSNHR